MKGKIFMYLFIFALLYVVFQYANSKSILDTYEEMMTKQDEREAILRDSIIILNKELDELKNIPK